MKFRPGFRYPVFVPVSIVLAGFMLFPACNSGKKEKMSDSVPVQESAAYQNDSSIMAEYDIAMTVRSIADAINYGENIDESYSYEGVLTDGRGVPLYTDNSGHPGRWKVGVETPSDVRIRNLATGNIYADALCLYITDSMGLSEYDIIEVRDDESGCPADEESMDVTYDFGRGYLRFSTDGKGRYLSIFLSAKSSGEKSAG